MKQLRMQTSYQCCLRHRRVEMAEIRVLVLLLFCGVARCLQVGDVCVRTYDKSSGICTPHRQCPSARDDYLKGIPLTYCSFSFDATVCCPRQTTSKRISASKCEEYGKLWEKRINVANLFLPTDSSSHSIVSFKCTPSTGLIFGGEKTKPGEFPHMAAIGWRRRGIVSFDCGGSLISDRYVLTAAHCDRKIDGVPPSFVRLGDQNLNSRSDNLREVDVDIENFIRHPQYSSKTSKNDIALLKLKTAVKFSLTVSPACLWQTSSVNYTKLIASGWGTTDELGLTKSDELMKVELNQIDTDRCNYLLQEAETIRSEQKIDGSQLCAGVETGGKDTCRGDSGGPLHIVIKDLNPCLFHLVGVTSFGSFVCGISDSAAVYTRVSHFLDWIENLVWG